MEKHALAEIDQALESEAWTEYVDQSGASDVITDGVVEPSAYLDAPKRILWFLKEPYDGGETRAGGGWSLTRDCLLNQTEKMAREKTFQPICYITYGILNGISDWDQMPWLRDSEAARNALRSIAFMNVSKLPGLKRSGWKFIADAYRSHRVFLLRQLRAYAPDIIFACVPHVHELAKDLGTDVNHGIQFGSASAIQIDDGSRLVWVHHPSQTVRGLGRRNYVNDAIRAATSTLDLLPE